MKIRLPLVLVLCFQASSLAEQAGVSRVAVEPPAVIRGRVLTSDADALPVRRARVAVVVNGKSSFPVFTDDEGRFELSVPESAAYTVAVRKVGFVRLSSARTASGAGDTLDVRLARAAVLSGRVVDSAGRPVSEVAVHAQRVEAPGRGASTTLADPIGETNDFGEFRIHGVPAGRYRLNTQPVIDGFQDLDSIAPDVRQEALDTLTASLTPLSRSVVVEAVSGQETSVVLQHSAQATVGVSSGGAVTGIVSDEVGEPLDDISVAMWKVEFDGGRTRAKPGVRARMTDDRGLFRLPYIPAGRYLVVATDGRWRADDPGSSYLPVFYPGKTTIADALEVEVPRDQGSGVINVNLVFSWARGATVRGVVTSTTGPPANRLVTLTRSFRAGGIAPPDRTSPTRADGSFDFPNLPSSEYVIRVTGTGTARLAGPPATPEHGVQYVSVGTADEGPVFVTTTPMSTLSGHVQVEGDARGLRPNQLGLLAVSNDPDSAPTNATGTPIHADGTFQLDNLAGSMRIALSGQPAGLWLKSVDVGNANAALDPVEFGRPGDSRDDVIVVLSSAVGAVSGRVLDETRPASGWVVVFARDEHRWFSGSPYLKQSTVARDARFSVPSLPPGDYWIAAIDADVSGTWLNPDVLNGLVFNAREVTIVEGRQVAVDLRLLRLPR